MAKRKVNNLENISNEIDWAALGKSSGLDLLSDTEEVKLWADTGILALNYACSGKFIGGGIPSGKIIEILGSSASGKSLLAFNILKGAQKFGIPILLDSERAVNKEFAKKASKINDRNFYIMEADTLEGCFAKIYSAVRNIRKVVPLDVPIFIVYDSIAGSPSLREYSEVEIDMQSASKSEMKDAGCGKDMPGERAKVCSKEFRKMPAFLDHNHASLIVINQLREKIGVMFGDNSVPAGGGRALPYYASLRLKLSSNKIPKDSKGNILGVNVNIQCIKNRFFRPYVEAKSVHLLFESGINPTGGLLSLLEQIGRIEKSGGSYVIKEPWAGGLEIKFKGSKERNDISPSVLKNCPALVDGTSADDVQYYIDLYQAAIDVVDHGISVEEDLDEDMMS